MHIIMFGLREPEVNTLLSDYDIACEMKQVKKWYNGYVFGDTIIYNPWSILNYTRKWREGFRPFWVNTSSNDLTRQILTQGSGTIKEDFERLLRREEIWEEIDENIVFQNIHTSSKALWSLLLFSGYLKVSAIQQGKRLLAQLAIPNLEIESLYEDVVRSWFDTSIQNRQHQMMLNALVNGDVSLFSSIFQDFIRTTFSIFDTSGQEPERVYHAFVLGLLVGLQDTHLVQSNRESGYGRYDVMIIPKDRNQLGVIIEFKKALKPASLDQSVSAALSQIEEKQYAAELQAKGIHRILKLGIAFAGKQVAIQTAGDVA